MYLYFWFAFLRALNVLYHPSVSLSDFAHVKELFRFMQEDMELNLRVTSWVEPMQYVFNDLAHPPDNIKLLLEFVDKQVSHWHDTLVIKTFRKLLTRLLDAYEHSETVIEFEEKTNYF